VSIHCWCYTSSANDLPVSSGFALMVLHKGASLNGDLSSVIAIVMAFCCLYGAWKVTRHLRCSIKDGVKQRSQKSLFSQARGASNSMHDFYHDDNAVAHLGSAVRSRSATLIFIKWMYYRSLTLLVPHPPVRQFPSV
jgi:hypothetical protein